MKYVYTAMFKQEDDGKYYVTFPDVPGCVTSGNSIAEAIVMAKDALAGCLCVLEDNKDALPAAKLPNEISFADNSFPAVIDVDTTQYRAENDNRSVRKNVSIPAWMELKAEKAGISLSQVLQEALRARLG